MNQFEQQQQQLAVLRVMKDATDVTCENCGNYTFQPVMLIKRISALISPTSEELMPQIPVMSCNACGHVNAEFIPHFNVIPATEAPTEPEAARPRISLV